ncbi:MAG: hypothetical protein QOI58_1788 [Thermoanaerobaculia bacterium]|jgi:hypothetical protein|nr:hypothetical protein [Thermoanaerobaculia bacterium]
MRAFDDFVTAARAFVAWAESPASADAHAEAVAARRNVVALIAAAIALPDGAPSLARSISDDEYQRVYRRFGALPFNYYSESFNPLVVPAEEPVVADLADDLADIWRDVKEGLLLYESGEPESAAWHWSNHYSFHWGHHATAALYALQSWFSSSGDDDAAERTI